MDAACGGPSEAVPQLPSGEVGRGGMDRAPGGPAAEEQGRMTPEERFERIERNLEATTAAQVRLTESMISMNESITRYVDASNARMTEIERSLKDLIRAITMEHKNGKQKG